MDKDSYIFDINPKNWLKPYPKTTVWYGMVGMAAIGGIAMFFYQQQEAQTRPKSGPDRHRSCTFDSL